jgi:DNA primase large subunit
MQNLHRSLRRDSHLKHYGRLQYTLFLKGIGLSLEECLLFWRQSFNKITDDTFNKEYRYNVRHTYGDVGGDANRRGNGYAPFSCQRILTEHTPGPGEAHGCPYRHFSGENLTALLQVSLVLFCFLFLLVCCVCCWGKAGLEFFWEIGLGNFCADLVNE